MRTDNWNGIASLYKMISNLCPAQASIPQEGKLKTFLVTHGLQMCLPASLRGMACFTKMGACTAKATGDGDPSHETQKISVGKGSGAGQARGMMCSPVNHSSRVIGCKLGLTSPKLRSNYLRTGGREG